MTLAPGMSTDRWYKVYINKVEMPLAPSKIIIRIPNRNEIRDLADGNQQTLILPPGLTEFEMDLIIPGFLYAGYKTSADKRFQKDYLELFEGLKVSHRLKPFELAIIRPYNLTISSNSLLEYCTLEDYELEENASFGRDVLVKLKIKKYRPVMTGVISVQARTQAASVRSIPSNLADDPPAQKTYTVQSGDTLSGIALKMLGAASKYTYLAEKNNISNPNLIRVGQVLQL